MPENGVKNSSLERILLVNLFQSKYSVKYVCNELLQLKTALIPFLDGAGGQKV